MVDVEAFRLSLEAHWRKTNQEKANDGKPEKSEEAAGNSEQTVSDERADNDAKAKGGRTAFDVVFMFKILLIKHKLKLSYASSERALVTRLDLHRFMGPIIQQGVPGASTIHRYEDSLDDDIVRDVFELSDKQLCDEGYKSEGG